MLAFLRVTMVSDFLNAIHVPVLSAEVVSALLVCPQGTYLDCTVGEGGHSASILTASSPPPHLIGIDLDEAALSTARKILAKHSRDVRLVKGNYAEMKEIVEREGISQVNGILMDLGLSSLQLEALCRGFSFQKKARLDMRFDNEQVKTAWDVVNRTSEPELVSILGSLGEEPRARRIAKAIVRARPIQATTDLAEIVARSVGGRRGRIHPATRTFQAIRIAVNEELKNIETGLQQASELLVPGGRLVVISYHSLEDSLVKRFIVRESRDCLCSPLVPRCACKHKASLRRISKKVVKPTSNELRANPRSRSARMRIAERLGA